MESGKILVVEDESIVAMDIGNRLKSKGFSVTGMATTGEEAIKSVESELPDPILMDIVLPGEIDGIDAAHDIRARFDIPVIYLTAYSDTAIVEKAKKTFPYGYIVKPFTDINLKLAIEMALEKHKLDIKRKESEKRLGDINLYLGEGIYILDINGHILFMNQEAEHLLGYTIDELQDKNAHDIIHYKKANGTAQPLNDCNILKVIETGERYSSTDEFFVRKDGTIFPASVVSSPITEKGRIVASLTVFRDIADQKKIEEELTKTKKLESLGILAGGIAHDFNNIFQAVIGYLYLARIHMPQDNKAYDILQKAEESCLAAKHLTYQLITFSAGGEPIRKPFIIREMIRDFVQFALNGSNIKYEFLMPDNCYPVEVDEKQMRQVILNIVSNAKDAMPSGGVLQFSIEKKYLTEKDGIPLQEGNYVRISIKDSGIGIPKENLSRIFDPYFSTKGMGSQKGMGLGLPVCYSIVKKHHGHIAVESIVGSGTTFHIYLPVAGERIDTK